MVLLLVGVVAIAIDPIEKAHSTSGREKLRIPSPMPTDTPRWDDGGNITEITVPIAEEIEDGEQDPCDTDPEDEYCQCLDWGWGEDLCFDTFG